MNSTINIGVLNPLVVGDFGEIIVAEPWFWRNGFTVDDYFNVFVKNLNIYDLESKWNCKFPLKESSLTSEQREYLFSLPMIPFSCIEHTIPQNTLRLKHYKELIRDDENFIVYITFGGTFNWKNLDKVYFPQDLQEYLDRGKCKVVFACYAEAKPSEYRDIAWIRTVSEKLNLTRKNCMVVTSNLNFKRKILQSGLDVNVTIEQVCGFEFDPWFNVEQAETVSEIEPDRLFTCLSRRLDMERLAMVSHLESNYKEDAYYSLGNPYREAYPDISGFSEHIQNEINQYCLKSVCDTSCGMRVLDDFDKFQSNNHASDVSTFIGKGFVNIVIETLPMNSDVLFFSEKIWKAVACKRPFILLGNRGSLEWMHRQGYITFSEFWDESYDREEDPYRRFDKVVSVIDYLAESSQKVKVEQIYRSVRMQEILQHNYNNFVKGKGKTNHVRNFLTFYSTQIGE